jgi:hypothetical protein
LNEKDAQMWIKAQREGRYHCHPSEYIPCTEKCELYKWCILKEKPEKVSFT